MSPTDFFKSLSDPTRLDILTLIMAQQPICVCELTAKLQLSQPKISRHLALLRTQSVLLDQRKGQWVYYQLHPDLPQWAIDILHIMAKQNDGLMKSMADQAHLTQSCD